MGSFFDNFSQLTDSYLKFRTAEAEADAAGTSQVQLLNQVEQPQGNGQVPLSSAQTQSVTNGSSQSFGGFTQKQLLIAAGVLGLVLIVKKV